MASKILPREWSGILEGELQSNYRVGLVYVERHAIWREVTPENSVYTAGKYSSVPPLPPLVGQTQKVYRQKHLEVKESYRLE